MTTDTAALYFGEVVHERQRPRKHRLRYRVFSMLVDVDELESLSAAHKLFSYNAGGLFSIKDSDHGTRPNLTMASWARQELERAGLEEAGHHIKALCYPRILGYVFNPLTVYFCHSKSGSLSAIIYEVHNTFGERHAYVISVNDEARTIIRQTGDKEFFVSPFIPMDCTYKFRVHPPENVVRVVMRVEDNEGLLLAASFAATHKAFSDRLLLIALLRFPLMTVKVIAGIHWEALKLWRKRIPYLDHAPKTTTGDSGPQNPG
ncbi:MAG: DUF1365 domain-containing protein [Alphaproteobacteria bacterium]|jgi:DUF1365 family protein